MRARALAIVGLRDCIEDEAMTISWCALRKGRDFTGVVRRDAGTGTPETPWALYLWAA